jgi:tetratricopeptide (TPR) repeat protein
LALLGALAISMVGSTALAQRFVPMRYDLRSRQARYGGNPYTTYRNYNPYAPYRGYTGYGGYYGAYGPAAQSDPYSFEALQQRNYFVTGNVRAGKSFQGTTPYQDSGSRLSTYLPSLRLSDFRRDSVGIEDIGTGVEYGLPLPYIPSSAAVTTPGMVDQRFAPAEAYIPPAVNPSYGYEASVPLPQAYEQPGDERVFWSPDVFLGEEGGAAAVPDNLPLPQGLWDRLEAYTEGGEETEPAFSLAQGAEGEEPEPFGAYGLRGTLPQNVYDPRRNTGAAEVEPPAFGGSALYWLKDEAASAAETGETEVSAEIAPQRVNTGAIVPPPTGGLQKVPESRYAEQVRRAHEALKAGRFAEADRIYSDAVALDPGRAAAAFGRVHALLGLAYYHQASLALVRYLRAHPAWAADLPDLKSVYADAQMYERTVSDLERSAKGEGATSAHRFLLGYVLCAGGRRNEARPYLEQAAASAEMKEAAQALLDVMAAGPPK